MARGAHDELGGRTGPRALRAALRLADLPAGQLWLDYLALGGEFSRGAFADALAGRRSLPPREFDRVAAALNDAFIDRGLGYRVTR